MKKLIFLLTACCLLPSEAIAEDAIVARGMYLRTGPGTDWPALAILPEGMNVFIEGCDRDVEWCEVEAGSEHGWASARYLDVFRAGQRVAISEGRTDATAIVVYDAAPYWDRYYRDKDFYRNRARWIRHHNRNHPDRPGKPPRPRPAPAPQQEETPRHRKLAPSGDSYNPLCRMGEKNC